MIFQAWADSGCNSEVGNIWYHSWCRGDTVRWYTVYNPYTVIYTRCSGDTTPLTVCIHCCAAAAVGKLFEFIRHFVAARFRNCPFWRSYTPDTGWHESSQGLHWSQAVCDGASRKIVSVLKFGISAQYSHFFQLAADDGLVNLPIMILYRIPKKNLCTKRSKQSSSPSSMPSLPCQNWRDHNNCSRYEKISLHWVDNINHIMVPQFKITSQTWLPLRRHPARWFWKTKQLFASLASRELIVIWA